MQSHIRLAIDVYGNVRTSAAVLPGQWDEQTRYNWEDIDNITWGVWAQSTNLSTSASALVFFNEETTNAWEDEARNWEDFKY